MLHMPLLFTSLLPFSWERWTAAYYRSPQRKFLCTVSFHHLNRIWQMCVKPGSYGEYHLNDNTVVSESIYTDFTMTPLSMVLVLEDISASPLFSNFQTSFSYHCFWQRILPQWLHFLFRSETTQSHINPSQFSHRTVKKQVAFHSPLKIRFHPLGGAIFVCQCGTASHASQTQMTRSDTLLSTSLLNFLLQHIQYSIVMSRYIQRCLPGDSSHIHVDATL